ncbi:unnamed protein product [Symbiodinium sp. CCMP2592]|nr:unnamed protein product [Symbiodinium sp. CCMP2592]
MGLRTAQEHEAYACHETFYRNEVRKGTDIILIENVCEYQLETVQSRLGKKYRCIDACIDPRTFGYRTARARRYIVALKQASVTWNPDISLHDVLLKLRRRPVMPLKQFFFMKPPVQKLSAWHAKNLAAYEREALGANLVLLASGAGRYMDYEDSESSASLARPQRALTLAILVLIASLPRDPCAKCEALARGVSLMAAEASASDLCDRFEQHLQHLTHDVVAPLSYPWDRNKALSAIFSGKPGRSVDLHSVKVPRVVPPPATQYRRPGDSDEPLPVALQCTKVVPVFEAVLKKPRLQAGEKAGVDRENVLRRWLCVLSHSPGASRLGVLIWAKGESDPLGVVAQALAGKATSTLLKRARFSARFICWADKHHVKAFPVSLEFLVSFLKPLAAEARNSAIREAMETVEQGISDNPWVKGALRGANIRTCDPRRSRVLKVEEVLLLEGALIEGALDKVDRYATGVFLFQLYSRARVSDLRNISKLELDLDGDTGFIEVRTYEHKNCRLSSGPGAVLILVAPYHGLHQKPWGAAWAEAAKAVGFDFEKGHRGPLLPRLACDYSWSGDAIDANETTTWIRALLSRLQAAEEDLTFSSHGLKATPLSWTSKAGYSERTQLVLGHHSLGPSGKTQEAYAREVQAQPLRDLAECLGAIRQGVFHPDRTKSGMIAGGATIRESRFSLAPLGRANLSPSHESFECAPEVELAEDGGVEPPDDQDLGEQEDVHEASSSESESSGESEEETHYESFGAGEAQNAIPSVNMGPDLDIFQNPKTKSLHSRAKGSTGKLICGRSLDNMKPFSGKVFSSRWLCKQCTAGRPLRDAGAMASFIAKKQGASK